MAEATGSVSSRNPALAYVVPFGVFLALLGIGPLLQPIGRWEAPLRVIILLAVLWAFSRDALDLRVTHWAGSIAMGAGVFAVWIAPDVLIPGYRDHWIFQNAVMGRLHSSIPPDLLGDDMVLLLRCFRAIILVPIIEELFWRAWLMRWIINPDFRLVKLGTYSVKAMWITALLFASEHGPYWEVGLAAGLLYNWWMVRARSLGDCILAHVVTNGALSFYVMHTGKWEYWL